MSPKSIHGLELVAMSTAVVYLFLIVTLRVFGRHPMSQLSPIDLVVLMLLGSSVETSMVHGSSLMRYGFVSATVLIAVNRGISAVMLRSKKLKNFVNGGPVILVNRGRLVTENLARVGLTQADVTEALRQREYGDLSEIRLAVLEPDGDVNVIGINEGH